MSADARALALKLLREDRAKAAAAAATPAVPKRKVKRKRPGKVSSSQPETGGEDGLPTGAAAVSLEARADDVKTETAVPTQLLPSPVPGDGGGSEGERPKKRQRAVESKEPEQEASAITTSALPSSSSSSSSSSSVPGSGSAIPRKKIWKRKQPASIGKKGPSSIFLSHQTPALRTSDEHLSASQRTLKLSQPQLLKEAEMRVDRTLNCSAPEMYMSQAAASAATQAPSEADDGDGIAAADAFAGDFWNEVHSVLQRFGEIELMKALPGQQANCTFRTFESSQTALEMLSGGRCEVDGVKVYLRRCKRSPDSIGEALVAIQNQRGVDDPQDILRQQQMGGFGLQSVQDILEPSRRLAGGPAPTPAGTVQDRKESDDSPQKAGFPMLPDYGRPISYDDVQFF